MQTCSRTRRVLPAVTVLSAAAAAAHPVIAAYVAPYVAGAPMPGGSRRAACAPTPGFATDSFYRFTAVAADPPAGQWARIVFTVNGGGQHQIVVKQHDVVQARFDTDASPKTVYYVSPGGEITFEVARCAGTVWRAERVNVPAPDNDKGNITSTVTWLGTNTMAVSYGPDIRPQGGGGGGTGTNVVLQAGTAAGGTAFHDAYVILRHNTYDEGPTLTRWLDQGLRSVDLDVIDKGDWPGDANGPFVTHGSFEGNRNCSGDPDRLGHCLKDILGWLDAHPGAGPILVFVDMKASWDPIGAWHDDEVHQLDDKVRQILDTRMFTGGDLYRFTTGADWKPGGKGLRQAVSERGWPTLQSLANQVVVAYTGGVDLKVNQTQSGGIEHVLDHAKRLPHGFFCPDLETGAPEIVPGGTIEGMSKRASDQVVCSNQQADERYYVAANAAAAHHQIMHLFGSATFESSSFSYNYLAVGHGVSAIGRDDAATSTFEEALPLRGVRRSVGVYVTLRPASASGQCVEAVNAGTGNGTKLRLAPCSGADAQRFVYTAPGALRPKHADQMCVDIEGGHPDDGKAIHLWGCGGDESQQWAVGPDGRVRAHGNSGFCIHAGGGTLGAGALLELRTCSAAADDRQRYLFRAAGDWPVSHP